MNTDTPIPLRGEVWRVNFDPTLGAEIRKTRPAIVISSNSIGKLPIKLIAPITGWSEAFEGNLWHVRIVPDTSNGLTKDSAADTLQIRGVDILRFIDRIGMVSLMTMTEIITAIAAVIEFEPDVNGEI